MHQVAQSSAINRNFLMLISQCVGCELRRLGNGACEGSSGLSGACSKSRLAFLIEECVKCNLCNVLFIYAS